MPLLAKHGEFFQDVIDIVFIMFMPSIYNESHFSRMSDQLNSGEAHAPGPSTGFWLHTSSGVRVLQACNMWSVKSSLD